jgi:aerobic-type carbon monoxide dehydrogenase small subunit (CoxS/CutS family)
MAILPTKETMVFVVTAKALLDKNPDPAEEEIREAISGNLCRCGTYPQHPRAVTDPGRILRGDPK